MISVKDLEEAGFEKVAFLDGREGKHRFKSVLGMKMECLSLILTLTYDGKIEKISGYSDNEREHLYEKMFTLEYKQKKGEKKMIKLKDLLNITEENVWVHCYEGDPVPFKVDKDTNKTYLDRELSAIKIAERHGVPSLHVWLEEK